MIAGTLCSRTLATVLPGDSVRVAARRMGDHDVGTLVVVESFDAGRAVGMLTDRDLAVRCVARGLDPDTTPVSMVMTSPVNTIDENAPAEFALAEMASAGTRRLVVTRRGGEAIGILSLDDLLALLAEQAVSLRQLLERQRPHVVA